MQAAKGNGNQRDEPERIESRVSGNGDNGSDPLAPTDGGKPVKIKNRKELLETIRPGYWKHLREDCGDLPDGWPDPRSAAGRTKAVAMNN